MIRLSKTARGQITSLSSYYVKLERPEAVRNLRDAVAIAGDRISAQQGPFFPAPRPYPNLTRPGWIWLKQGPYWIAYTAQPKGATIQVVFHETADIPNRI